MTNEELVYMIQNFDNKTEYIEKLYLQNYGLICKIAKMFTRFYDLDDLIQEGVLGLLTAAELYNESYGYKFTTYASESIKSHILRFLENNGNTIRLPVNQILKIWDAEKVSEDFYKLHGHEPSEVELAEVMQITPNQAKKVLQDASMLNLKSINEPIPSNDDSLELLDTIADPNDQHEDTEEKIQNEQLKKVLWGIVDSLEDEQAKVIHLKYEGNNSGIDIAGTMGISTGKVRTIETHAMRELRKTKYEKQLRAFYPDDRIYSISVHGSSYKRFKETHTSIQEMYLLLAEKHGV